MELAELGSGTWWANKRRIGGGACVYICQYVHSNGKHCRRTVEFQDAGRVRKYSHCAEWLAAAGRSERQRESEEPLHYCWQHRISGPFQSKAGGRASD